MSAFQKKQLTPTKRVCLRLKEAREKNGMSLIELAKKTKLSKKYLEALEECRFNDLPPATVYQKNFVKCYVEALGINANPFLKQYLNEEVVKTNKTTPKTTEVTKAGWLASLPLILKFSLISLLIVIMASYLGLQIKHILEPPLLVIYSPEDGFITEQKSILVQGKTEKEVNVSINGQSVMNSEEGQFAEMINLSPGINTLSITAQKKHGKTTTETRHVVLKQSYQFSYSH